MSAVFQINSAEEFSFRATRPLITYGFAFQCLKRNILRSTTKENTCCLFALSLKRRMCNRLRWPNLFKFGKDIKIHLLAR